MEIMKTNMENCKLENLNKVEHSNVPKRHSNESFYFSYSTSNSKNLLLESLKLGNSPL